MQEVHACGVHLAKSHAPTSSDTSAWRKRRVICVVLGAALDLRFIVLKYYNETKVLRQVTYFSRMHLPLSTQ